MRLFLNGGGSGLQVKSALEKMNEIMDHSKPLLYIPLALDEQEFPYDDCYEWIKNELINISISNIDMVRTFEELSLKELNDYSVIFIGGGNTYKLLKGLKDSGAFDKIKEYIANDGIVFGGSAGSVIFGKDINISKFADPNDVNLIDTLGFDVINGLSIFPHYTNKDSQLTDYENEERYNKSTEFIIDYSITNGPVIAYPEEDTLYINGDNIEMLGNRDYYYIANGNISKYEIYDRDNIKNMIK